MGPTTVIDSWFTQTLETFADADTGSPLTVSTVSAAATKNR